MPDPPRPHGSQRPHNGEELTGPVVGYAGAVAGSEASEAAVPAARRLGAAMSELGAAVAFMRERGLRLSAARRLVLEALLVADGPMSAEQIAQGIGGRVPSSDIASVYRNLQAFEDIGLVRHVHLGPGPALHDAA